MKKKFFSLVFAFAFILTGTLCLTACNDEVKYYYTVDMPEHCEIVFMGQKYNDKGTYVLEDESIEFHINVEDGYQSSNFKLYIDSSEVAPTLNSVDYDGTTITYSYIYSFTPTADFTIKATGNFTKVVKQLTMTKKEGFNNDNNLFIRFEENNYGLPTEETAYSAFVNEHLNNFAENITFGEGFSFDIYYKGTEFVGDPCVADGPSTSCESTLYYENNEIGQHFTFVQWYESANITFGNYISGRHISLKTSEMGTSGDELISDKLDIKFLESDGKTVTITFKTNIDEDVRAGLRLLINGQDQNIDFTDNSTSGVFTVNLKNPWESYGANNDDTNYYLDLNFYEFEYFDGVVATQPPVE